MALATGRTVNVCLYLALASERGTVMITADQRLVNTLTAGPLARYLPWIGSL